MSSRSLEGLTDFRKSDFQKPQDADKPLHEGKQFNEGCVQSSPFCIDTVVTVHDLVSGDFITNYLYIRYPTSINSSTDAITTLSLKCHLICWS